MFETMHNLRSAFRQQVIYRSNLLAKKVPLLLQGTRLGRSRLPLTRPHLYNPVLCPRRAMSLLQDHASSAHHIVHSNVHAILDLETTLSASRHHRCAIAAVSGCYTQHPNMLADSSQRATRLYLMVTRTATRIC